MKYQIIKITSLFGALCMGGFYSLPSFANNNDINLIDTSAIDNSFTNNSGLIGINLNSGDLNLQANNRAFSVGDTQLGIASASSEQNISNSKTLLLPNDYEADISGNAFSSSAGIISLNQASGSENKEVNQIAVSLGLPPTSASDQVLGNTLSSEPSNSSNSDTSNKNIYIAGTAFQGTTGLVQINQAAGFNNSIANNFALHISP